MAASAVPSTGRAGFCTPTCMCQFDSSCLVSCYNKPYIPVCGILMPQDGPFPNVHDHRPPRKLLSVRRDKPIIDMHFKLISSGMHGGIYTCAMAIVWFLLDIVPWMTIMYVCIGAASMWHSIQHTRVQAYCGRPPSGNC